MKKVILVLATLCCFVAPAFADKPAPPPHKKHKHKVTVVVPPPAPVSPPVVEAPPVVLPPPVVVPPPAPVPPPKPVFVPKKICGLKPTCPDWESRKFIPEAHLAVGVGAQAPWASGLLGLRMEFPVGLGAFGIEPFVSIPYGVGADFMIYAFHNNVVQFYPLSVGAMINWNYGQKTGAFGTNARFLSDQDINRLWDLRLGAGVSVKLACHVFLAFDWRVSIPDPVKLAKDDHVCVNCGNGSHYLDANTAVGNAFAQSQLLVGILVR